MKIRLILPFFFILVSPLQSNGQQLKAGYNKDEYKQMVLIFSTTTGDSANYVDRYGYPKGYEKIYRSDEMALDNLWELWVNEERAVGVVSIRGSTEERDSWILNLYSSMIPAKGEISWKGQEPVQYDLSDDPEASVHVGWTVGMAFIYADMLPRMLELYDKGIKQFILTGHSQGGVITILLTSHLLSLQKKGKIPQDIIFKTYASAAPKPGNMAFAQSYNNQVKKGWAFNVVNAADWVPEIPMAVDTYDDFNHSNPLSHAKSLLTGGQSLRRAVLGKVHDWIEEPTKDLFKFQDRTIGEMTNQIVMRKIPGLNVPEFDTCLTYVSAGNTIVYYPHEAYFEIFERGVGKTFKHHDRRAYLLLIDKHGNYINNLEDKKYEWYLTAIGDDDSKQLFPDVTPTVVLDKEKGRVYGYLGCATFQCNIKLEGKDMSIDGPVVVTENLCRTEREEIFLENLKKANNVVFKKGKLVFRWSTHEKLTFEKR